jgi:hypothetical protein
VANEQNGKPLTAWKSWGRLRFSICRWSSGMRQCAAATSLQLLPSFKSKLYTAKLTRGNLWSLEWKIDGVLHEIEFHRNVRVVIDDELHDHLYAYAVDYVNVEGSGQPEERSKFEYADYKGEAKVGTWLEQPKREPVHKAHLFRRPRFKRETLPLSDHAHDLEAFD